MATIFSKIIAGEAPLATGEEDDRVLCVHCDINPLVKGHTLSTIPKQGSGLLFDLNDEDLAAMHVFAKVAPSRQGFPVEVGESVLGLEASHAHT